MLMASCFAEHLNAQVVLGTVQVTAVSALLTMHAQCTLADRLVYGM